MMTGRDAGELRIGTAGWSVPGALRDRFPEEGTHLRRYAAVLNAVEINSSFYRAHRPSTYARWAASVPDGFRFSVKLPRTITHERRLKGCEREIADFAAQVGELGVRLGPVLVQLPPSFAFPGSAPVERVVNELVRQLDTQIVVEPRHATWFAPEVDALLASLGASRVAADPPPAPQAAVPGGWQGFTYWRLHGSPRIYYSDYSPVRLVEFAEAVGGGKHSRRWVVFDNTAAGAALANALEFMRLAQAG